jgi:phosphoenolpyruvate carboxylase
MPRTLSADIHLVGDTLGAVLRAHGSEELYREVEAMRHAAKTARGNDAQSSADARKTLADLAAGMTADMAADVARAFTLYFQLVNVAEDVHRSRTVRARELRGEPIEESFEQAFEAFATHGVPREEAMAILEESRVGYIFTAHPTEARRRTTERLLTEVRRSLELRDREELTSRELLREDRRLRATIEALFEHAPDRRDKPSVLDEVKAGLWYIRNVLLDVVPTMHRRLHRAFEAQYGRVDPAELSLPIAFGSWMGSDRDGNPFVTDTVTERALELQRWITLDRYAADLDDLIDPLAGCEARLRRHEGLEDALVRATAAVPERAREADRRNPDEPLRRMLTLMKERIERTRSFSAGAYPNPTAFLDDIEVVRNALRHAGAVALPDDGLLDLVQRVRCFGFHLAALDAREDSAVHHDVLAELLGDPGYAERSSADRWAAVQKLELPRRGTQLSRGARRLLDLFATIRRLQARFGAEAISTYIISMTATAADVLEVLRLAELHAIAHDLDIVPLLETPEDLERAGPLLEELLAVPAYRAHLAKRRNVQELLVGYSDSMKRGGILASRVRVVEAQRAASRVCNGHDVRLRVFHGRGGSVSRGGGPTSRAIGALPLEAFSGEMKITEQGEMRSHNFANPALAARYLEQTLGAALVTRARARRHTEAHVDPDLAKLLERLASSSQAAYQKFVADEGLVPYFRTATPFEAIATMRIGSRPSKRRQQTAGLDDLRAIPWVFSWSQSRHVLTGWYGVGTALEEVGIDAVAAARPESRFLVDLFENVEMTLAKSEREIARRYSELCPDESIRRRIFAAVESEHERTCRGVLAVLGQDELLDDDEVLKRSIRLRNPYVDPLSYLQIEALRRIHDGDDSWYPVAHVTIQGIAAGLRNTG